MPAHTLTREEANQRAQLLTVDSYDIDLDLRDTPSSGTFRSTTTVRFSCARAGAKTFIDLMAATVREVRLNGKQLEVSEVCAGSRVLLTDLVAGPNELLIDADCTCSDTGEGMHRFIDPVDHETYLYTQFEVANAHRTYACFDQPDLKATFRFTISTPGGWTVVSNTPTPVTTDGIWHFAPTPRMSTYVTAVIAGPYHKVQSAYEKDGRTVPLGVYCRPSLASHLDAEAIFDVTRQGLEWLEEKLGHEYPFTKYDQIFVPEFNVGAMENLGAVTIREGYVFQSKVTDERYEARAGIILHELSHMWFGNLVTMRWWDDLWLKESLATYIAFACQSEMAGSQWPHAWVRFLNVEKAEAYEQDQLPTTHPVIAPIGDIDDVAINFDGITYAKGASVIRQLVAYVGFETFREGMRAYLTTHQFGNAGLDDLLTALEKASARNLTDWSNAWLHTAGINVLRARMETSPDGVITSFAIEQEVPVLPGGSNLAATARPHRVAIGLYKLRSGELVRENQIELEVTGRLTPVPQLTGIRRPAVLLLNDDDLAYAKVRLDEESFRAVTEHLGCFVDPLPRTLCWTAAWDMAQQGELPAQAYVNLVCGNIDGETDIGLVEILHKQTKLAIDTFASPAWRDAGMEMWADTALSRLQTAEPGSDYQLAWARAFAEAASTPVQLRLLSELIGGQESVHGLVLDTGLRWLFVQRLVAVGQYGEDEIAVELKRDSNATRKQSAAVAMAARPTSAAKEEAWAQLVDSENLPSPIQKALIAGFARPEHRHLTAPFTHRYFAAVQDIWRKRSLEYAQRIVVGLYPSAQVTQETLDVTDAWLQSAHPNPALRRLILERRAGVERALRAQVADTAGHRVQSSSFSTH